MTLPVSGAISFNAINVELGVAGTTTANINQASYRTLAGVPGSGTTIALSNFYGKSNRVSISSTFSSSTANASLNVSAIGGYIAGISDITVTINGGVYLYATSTGGYGLNLTGATSGDTITVVNNGFIMGQGGNGGTVQGGGGTPPAVPATSGGTALNIGTGINVTINNTNGSAYIGGGGGGGQYAFTGGGGGGAGGGNGGNLSGQTSGGGAGGAIGSSGANGSGPGAQGGGGGRIFPGSGGVSPVVASGFISAPGTGGGAGGGGGSASSNKGTSQGGTGGSGNGVGVLGTGFSGAGGGGWGANGGGNIGLGGKAVNLNGKTVTWVSGDTTRVYGAVS